MNRALRTPCGHLGGLYVMSCAACRQRMRAEAKGCPAAEMAAQAVLAPFEAGGHRGDHENVACVDPDRNPVTSEPEVTTIDLF